MSAGDTMDGRSGTMSPKAFQAIAALAKEEAGLVLTQGKATMIQSRLRKRVRALGLTDVDAYAKFVTSREGEAERRNMVSALTTNVSHFFRESHHFDLLRNLAFPALIDRATHGGKVRIWSAGCSSGQEPYSIAMSLLAMSPELAQRDVLILATDIDPNILSFAQAATFSEQQVAGITDAMKKSFLTRTGEDGKYQVNAPIRRLVRFRELNLHGDWPMRAKFDVIFCRNVVIYFDPQDQAALWPRFHAALDSNGWMMLGHSERISDSALNLFTSVGPTAYRPVQAVPGTAQVKR